MKTENQCRVHDVFKTNGQPTITYVEREDGALEEKLTDSITKAGTICLLTGPSKTGKTALYVRVAARLGREIIKARCDKALSARDVWKKALEDVSFERLCSWQKGKQISAAVSGEIEGSVVWAWLAGLKGKIGAKVSGSKEESETKERILAEASPSHLAPLLKSLPVLFVLEDFHYLDPDVQTTILQQWKVFVDNEVSIVVVCTTHHAVDLVSANRDLIGRLEQIDVPIWKREDLVRIAHQGFAYMNVQVDNVTIGEIAEESVGLPIVTQAICLQLLLTKNIKRPMWSPEMLSVSSADVFTIFHSVAVHSFGVFENIYDRLIRGLRKQRKYKTYELVLSSFTVEQLAFSLTRNEIIDRMKKLPIPLKAVPPLDQVKKTLRSLATLQKTMDVELLEWRDSYERLYILEPTFLFYLRWRSRRAASLASNSVLAELFNTMGQLSWGETLISPRLDDM